MVFYSWYKFQLSNTNKKISVLSSKLQKTVVNRLLGICKGKKKDGNATLLKFLAHKHYHGITIRILGKKLTSSNLSRKRGRASHQSDLLIKDLLCTAGFCLLPPWPSTAIYNKTNSPYTPAEKE